MYRIGIICEGPTDRIILEAILASYADDYEPIPIQPPISSVGGGDAGPLGGGWKGIRNWCQQEMSNMDNLDLVIIQVDADVLHDNEINEILPCPPPEYRADALRRRICEWLGLDVLPKKLVCCIPTMTSETWAFVALFQDVPEIVPCNNDEQECIECRLEVKSLLRQYGKKIDPKLVVSQEGRLKNQAEGYRRQEKKITSGWDAVIKRCTQAKRFDTELRDIIQS